MGSRPRDELNEEKDELLDWTESLIVKVSYGISSAR